MIALIISLLSFFGLLVTLIFCMDFKHMIKKITLAAILMVTTTISMKMDSIDNETIHTAIDCTLMYRGKCLIF